MAVLQMRKLCICGLKKERKPILELLQHSGVVQINKGEANEDIFEKMDTQVAKAGFERNAAIAESALEILDEYAPEKKGMFASLEGKRILDNDEATVVVKNREKTIQYANKIINLKKEAEKIESDIIKLEAKLEAITPWLNMDVAGLTRGTIRTSYFYGSLPDIYTQETLYKKIEEVGTFPEASDVRVFYSDKNQTCVAGFCMKKDEGAFEDALRSIGFAKPSLIMRSVPAVSKEKWLKRLEDFKAQKEEIEQKIIELADKRIELENVADYFRGRADKYQILGAIDQSKHTFFITGYIPEKEAEKLKNKISENYTVYFDTEEIPLDEEMPVKLENGAFGSPVEGVVESFGLPKRGEIDPSNVMAFFYYFLFGMMLSDAAYGFLMWLGCFIVIKKFKRMNPSLKKSIQMFMYCGISTVIWGVLFGGYFGDAVTLISQTFFDKTIVVPALWFAPLDEPMRLLIYSMAIGLVHMFVGLGLKAYTLIKDKKYLDAIYDVGFWYFLVIGLVMMLVPSELFESISQTDVDYPSWFSTVAYVLTIVGLVGILLMSGRRKGKKWALRIALGAYDIYGVSSWLSDVLSYSRLLALGLATGVIGSVINLMGSMVGDGVLGTIVFISVFIVGHILNMAINILGAYVHTNRLQFVEFFGKFYEGGGEAFEPFAYNTKYVDLEDAE